MEDESDRNILREDLPLATQEQIRGQQKLLLLSEGRCGFIIAGLFVDHCDGLWGRV